MACRSCARSGNYGQGTCQSCTLMETMHKPIQPSAQDKQRQYEEQMRQSQRAAEYERQAMQQRFEYEQQARQQHQRLQQRSPYDLPTPFGPNPQDIQRIMQSVIYGRNAPSPASFTGTITKQMYLKII